MRLLPSQRAHLYVLERARVVVRDDRVEYVSAEGREPKAFNIPVANTSFLLLGPGCSISSEAVRRLKDEGVCLGFCGSGGTPLLAADDAPQFLMPADEYRDPTFLHRWMRIWLDPAARLASAKSFMNSRASNIDSIWPKMNLPGPVPDPPESSLRGFHRQVISASDVATLLGCEGNLTRELYAAAARACGFDNFERVRRNPKNAGDPNRLLDNGNYLAYGLASVVLWTYGIPSSLSVVHGKTRRGGLVFDLADVVKDAIILPAAFNVASRAANESLSETDFRSTCIALFDDYKVLPKLFDAFTSAIDAGETCLS